MSNADAKQEGRTRHSQAMDRIGKAMSELMEARLLLKPLIGLQARLAVDTCMGLVDKAQVLHDGLKGWQSQAAVSEEWLLEQARLARSREALGCGE